MLQAAEVQTFLVTDYGFRPEAGRAIDHALQDNFTIRVMNLELNAVDHRTLVLLWGLLARNQRQHAQNMPSMLREEIAVLEAKQASAVFVRGPCKVL